jgi:hypothetical protein
MTTAARTAVTCAMFAAIVALHVLPLPESPPMWDRHQPAAFIVAVVAVQSWSAAAALAQMLILIAPRVKLRRPPNGRFIDPYGVVVLLGTFLIAWVLADDAATNLAILLDASNAAGWLTYGTLLAAMLAGTAAVIAAAFVIDRFGLGRGFWIAIAVQFGVVIWAAGTADWPMAPAWTPMNIAAFLALATVVIAMTLHAMRSPASNSWHGRCCCCPSRSCR